MNRYIIIGPQIDMISCTAAKLDYYLTELHWHELADGLLIDTESRMFHDLSEQASCAWEAQEQDRQHVRLESLSDIFS